MHRPGPSVGQDCENRLKKLRGRLLKLHTRFVSVFQIALLLQATLPYVFYNGRCRLDLQWVARWGIKCRGPLRQPMLPCAIRVCA